MITQDPGNDGSSVDGTASTVRLRYGTTPGGSLSFRDGEGRPRRVVGGKEFEVDAATAMRLVKGDPRVQAVPRIELELRGDRPDLTSEDIRDLVTEARAHVEGLGDIATPDAIRAEVARRAPPPPGLPSPARRRRRGRPKGTRTITRDQIIERFRSLKKNYGRAPTQDQLAANLVPRIEVRTLQDHLTDYDLPWPIE